MTQASATAIIELVDSEILARGASGELLRAPGFALLENKGIATGDAAFRQAWLFPQRSYNQFWHQLNLAPLPAGNQYARHFADLAYAQLDQLHRALGAPGEVLFAIPGSFSRDQLAILLGLANALPVKTLGLIDAAVAAASGIDDYRGELLHLDIQLHQAVITRLRAADTISRESVEILSEAGLKHFHGGWAQYIANLFIREYRYDPLHTAEGEQQLFSKLPDWLDQLATSPETTVALDTPRGSFRLSLQRSGLVESALPRISRLRDLLLRLDSGGPLLASYRLGRLPGVAGQLNARVLPEQQVIGACQAVADNLVAGTESVDFITHLPRTGTSGPVAARQGEGRQIPPTHVLFRHRAWPIGEGLGIEVTATGPQLDRNPDAPLRIESHGAAVRLVNRGYDIVVDGNRDNLRPGDLIRVGGHELRLIEVAPNS